MGQSYFNRRVIRGLPEQPKPCPQCQPGIGHIRVGPKNDIAIRQQVARMLAERRLRDDFQAFRLHDSECPDGERDGLVAFIDDGVAQGNT